MFEKLTSLAGSWKTSLLGGLALLCSGSDVLGLLPEKYAHAMSGLCMILVSLGVIAAKDFNKTNAVVATTVPQTVPLSPNPPDQVMVKRELDN